MKGQTSEQLGGKTPHVRCDTFIPSGESASDHKRLLRTPGVKIPGDKSGHPFLKTGAALGIVAGAIYLGDKLLDDTGDQMIFVSGTPVIAPTRDTDLLARVATLEVTETPIPTDTPQPTATKTSTPEPTSTLVPTATADGSWISPVSDLDKRVSFLESATPEPTRTSTPTPTKTPHPTRTPAQEPTSTPVDVESMRATDAAQNTALAAGATEVAGSLTILDEHGTAIAQVEVDVNDNTVFGRELQATVEANQTIIAAQGTEIAEWAAVATENAIYDEEQDAAIATAMVEPQVTPVPTDTEEPTIAPSQTATVTEAPTKTPTEEPTETPTNTPTKKVSTATATPVPTKTPTKMPEPTEKLTETATLAPTEEEPATATSEPLATFRAIGTARAQGTPMSTVKPEPTCTPTPKDTTKPTQPPEPTQTPTVTPEALATEEPTATLVVTPTGTPAIEPVATTEQPTIQPATKEPAVEPTKEGFVDGKGYSLENVLNEVDPKGVETTYGDNENYGTSYANTIGLGSEMTLAEPGGLFMPDGASQQIFKSEEATQSLPQGGWVFASGEKMTVAIDDVKIKLYKGENTVWFLVVRGPYGGGDKTMAFTDYTVGNTEAEMIAPEPGSNVAFWSEGQFLQKVEMAGEVKVRVMFYDANSKSYVVISRGFKEGKPVADGWKLSGSNWYKQEEN